MSPEKIISFKTKQEVLEWAYSKESCQLSFRMRDREQGSAGLMHMIEGEPLIIVQEKPSDIEYKLSCSRKLSRELSREEIVKFPKPHIKNKLALNTP